MTGEILYDSRYGQLTPEVAEKIRKSREEVKKLKSRTLRCPVCGFRLEEIYELTSGYVQVKCRKCKLEEPLNLAEFVLYEHQPFALVGLGYELLYKGGLASAQKAGKNINLGHLLLHLFP